MKTIRGWMNSVETGRWTNRSKTGRESLSSSQRRRHFEPDWGNLPSVTDWKLMCTSDRDESRVLSSRVRHGCTTRVYGPEAGVEPLGQGRTRNDGRPVEGYQGSGVPRRTPVGPSTVRTSRTDESGWMGLGVFRTVRGKDRKRPVGCRDATQYSREHSPEIKWGGRS